MKKAFTLLEMLVVIGIIAILVTLGFASYSTVQKKARDAKRQGDLKAAQQVMEQCYSVNSFQYSSVTNTAGVLSTECPAPNNSIVFSMRDPMNNDTYKYVYTTSTTTGDYTITATLENGSTFTVTNQQ